MLASILSLNNSIKPIYSDLYVAERDSIELQARVLNYFKSFQVSVKSFLIYVGMLIIFMTFLCLLKIRQWKFCYCSGDNICDRILLIRDSLVEKVSYIHEMGECNAHGGDIVTSFCVFLRNIRLNSDQVFTVNLIYKWVVFYLGEV